jgi:hypothetical protein
VPVFLSLGVTVIVAHKVTVSLLEGGRRTKCLRELRGLRGHRSGPAPWPKKTNMPPKRRKGKASQKKPAKRRKTKASPVSSEAESFDSDSDDSEKEEEEEDSEEEEEESVLIPRTSKFNDVDRAFVQRLMTASSLTETAAEDLLSQVSEQFAPQKKERDLTQVIRKINRSLKKCAGLEIVKRTNDAHGEIHYGIVNTDGDQVAEQHASMFQPWEHELLREIMTIVVTKEQGFISQEELSHQYSIFKKSRKKDEEESRLAVEKFKQNNWLATDDRGLCLGARSFLEMSDELFTLGAAKCSKTNQLVIKDRSLWQYKNHFEYKQAMDDEEEEE